MITRRSLITSLVTFVAAPAIVRATSIMPARSPNHLLWPLHAKLHGRLFIGDFYLDAQTSILHVWDGQRWRTQADAIFNIQ